MLNTSKFLLKQMYSFQKGPTPFFKSQIFKNKKFSFRPTSTTINTLKQDSDQTQIKNLAGVGLQKYLTRVYNTTGMSICGALAAAYIGAALPFTAMHPFATMIGGTVVALASFMGVQATTPTTITQHHKDSPTPIYRTQNSPSRLLMYSTGIAALGLSTSPLFGMVLATNPSIITASVGLTMGIFGGASLVAYRLPSHKVLGYGRILMGSLIGLIGMQIIGLCSLAIMGPNSLSMLLFSAQNYLGIALFTALIGYDTHVAMAQYRNGIADHLRLSVQLVLDFWNLLVRIMQIMMMFRQ